jgi:transposase InsO family protein
VRIRYRTPQQLGLLERFHGKLKKEEVHWRLYDGPQHARQCLEEFRDRYNRIRPHWALRPDERVDPLTPADVYENGLAVILPQWQEWARAALGKLEKAHQEREAA